MFGYQRTIVAIFTFFAVILFSGCVENLISIHILPDGTPSIEFTSRGDSTDIFDNDFSHPPPGLPWSLNVYNELVDDSVVWIKETSGYLTNPADTVYLSSAPGRLNHFFTITMSTGLFATRYNLNYTFEGRRVYQKYPLLGREILNDFQGDSTIWLPEVLNYVLGKALNDMAGLPSTNYSENFLEHLENHFKNYFSRIQYSQQSEELSHNTRSIIIDALQPFQSRLTPGFTDTLLQAVYPYEREFETTINLYDDHFRVLAMLPGTMTTTNADSVLTDTLIWNFSVGEVLNDDLVIQASSVMYFQTRVQKLALGIIILISLTVFITSFWKKKRL
ncbi:MAG: hypothetical protein V3U16_04345 [Candidatus Neomarinimicrobiota bacterium]